MNKILSKVFALLIITGFIVIGYFTYQSYNNKKDSNDDDVVLNNYYNTEYLFNSGFIKKAKTIEDFSSKTGSISIDNNIMHIKYIDDKNTYEKNISNLPSSNITVYYNHIENSYYEFIASDNENTYYLYTDLKNQNDEQFNIINERVGNIYIPAYDKSYIYVNKNDKLTTNFMLASSGDLKYVDYDGKYVLKDDVESKKPYFDYVCAAKNNSLCSNLIIYINFNGELVYNGETVKYKDKHIYVKDVFSSLEISTNDIVDFDKLTLKKLKNKEYTFTLYIIDKNGIMYKLEIYNDTSNLTKVNNSSNKVKEYLYEDKDAPIIRVVFADNTKEIIQSANNKIITTSTIYDKENVNEKVIAP